MTKYDFDKIIDRRNTDCLKYDFAIQRGRPTDVLPFWVADMDFPIAREIDEQYEQNCVICTAPSKTFNIAGLQVSNIFIPNKNLRQFTSPLPQAGSGSRLQPGKYHSFYDVTEKTAAFFVAKVKAAAYFYFRYTFAGSLFRLVN
jgi:bifunctional pyridoxal-dependent enzyme with beta-cystathionase and maltose regulon repressor activities